MKNQFINLFIGVSIISLTSGVAPVWGQSNNLNQTVVAAQTKTTNITNANSNNMYAGISEILRYNIANHNVISYNNTNIDIVTSSNNLEELNLWYEAFTTTTVNVRKEPNTDSEILEILPFNQSVTVCTYNDEWVKVLYNDTEAYLNSSYIADEKCEYRPFNIPTNRGFKSFMPYNTITDKSSRQYAIQTSHAYTGDYGIRTVDNRYCIALGTAFNATVGTYVDLVLENGTIIPCIIGDIKDNKHTNADNITTTANGCVSEFIIDLAKLNSDAKRDGDMSSCKEEWDSPVVTINIYEENILD